MPSPDQTESSAGSADLDLVLRTRSGDSDAFAELFRRHYRSGLTVARSITTAFDADDLVQESYSRIYQAILKGGGPTGAFRAYLFTSIRNTAASWGRARQESNLDALDVFADPDAESHVTDDALDRSLTVRAFRSLPSRWQEVLWYTEIEQMKPAEVAPLLALKPVAVAQLAFRAREGLREAWIQAHLQTLTEESDCHWTVDRLGAYARGNLSKRDRVKVDDHLDGCSRCTIVAAEAKHVSSRLALVLLPLTLGAGAATAYAATLQGGSAPIVALAAGQGSVPGAVNASGASGAPAAASSAAGSASVGAGAVTGFVAAGLAAAAAVAAIMVLGPARAPLPASDTASSVAVTDSSRTVAPAPLATTGPAPSTPVEATPSKPTADSSGGPVPSVAPETSSAPSPHRPPASPATPAPAPTNPAPTVTPPADPTPEPTATPTPTPTPTDPTPPTETPDPEPVPTFDSGWAIATADGYDASINVSGAVGSTVVVLVDGTERVRGAMPDSGVLTLQFSLTEAEWLNSALSIAYTSDAGIGQPVRFGEHRTE